MNPKKSFAGLPSKTIIQASFWLAAIAVGFVGILFDKIFHWAQQTYFTLFENHTIIFTLCTPILFVCATAVVVFFAPNANGSGIPQALKAMMMSMGSHQTAMKSGLISLTTAFVKVLSSTIGILAGASIGREGPTVQISTSLFAWMGSKVKKKFTHADFHSFLVAGAAAGVSAAFNTPLAGISFAIEEMAEGSFFQIKQTVMVSVIIAGITTQAVLGNYLYFGNPVLTDPGLNIIYPAILMGVIGGTLGGLFARSLAFPAKYFTKYKWWKQALFCGVLCAAVNYLSGGTAAGTGYEITKEFMESPTGDLPIFLPFIKLFTTMLSYLSGMAGGIFSPSLAVGAGLGVTTAKLLSLTAVKTCALLGMVAFFTGVVQAPLTAVIIVMEMTDLHEVIIPLMIAAFVAQGISKAIMPQSLYHYLAHHRPISPPKELKWFKKKKHY